MQLELGQKPNWWVTLILRKDQRSTIDVHVLVIPYNSPDSTQNSTAKQPEQKIAVLQN
jgi:hypothetical protein